MSQMGQKTYFYGKGLIAGNDSSSLEKRYYHYNNIGSTTEDYLKYRLFFLPK